MELLAPAGNMTCLHAAVRAGADAVYLGLDSFNARRGADNFNINSLKKACHYAHIRNRKIYLTLNIIIFENEIQDALDLAIDAANAGVDAFIVQDVGLATLIKKYIPNVRLHVSTQMNTHNKSGMIFAKSLGADRVTLARELSFSEIEELIKLGIEVECFAHGALCVCYSGQCLMSSMIGGRSANRGKCAQACRLNYELDNSIVGDYLLSPKDLCTINSLKKFNDIGVKSLKIEGRMKSPEYVNSVVSVYRKVIDNNFKVEKEDLRKLEEAFSRGFSEAYLKNIRDNEMMSYKRPNNRGINIGRIDASGNISTKYKLNKGDVLEVWTKKGRTVFTYGKDKNLKNVSVGDRVFRVRNINDEFKDDEFLPKVKVDAKIEIKLNKKLKLQLGDKIVYGNIVEKARTKSITKDEVIEHINRFGGTDYELNNIDVELDEGVGLSYSELHKIKNEAVKKLNTKEEKHIKKVKLKKEHTNKEKKEIQICAICTNPEIARKAYKLGVDQVYVPYLNFKRGHALYAGEATDTISQSNYPKDISFILPTVMHEEINVKGNFIADSVGYGGEIGPHIPVVNKHSVKLFNTKRIWLSPELSLNQIKEITNSDMSFGLYIIGRQELMITKHCILMSQGKCNQQCETCSRRKKLNYLTDRKNYKFPVVTDIQGISHIYNSVSLDICYCMDDLIDAGIDSFMIDTTLMTKNEASQAIGRALSKAKDKPKNTTTGHLFREVL